MIDDHLQCSTKRLNNAYVRHMHVALVLDLEGVVPRGAHYIMHMRMRADDVMYFVRSDIKP